MAKPNDIQVIRVPDDELEQLAKRKGSSSLEAQVLGKLRSLRAKDRQVHAFKFGKYMIAGPTPDAETEQIMIELAEEGAVED